MSKERDDKISCHNSTAKVSQDIIAHQYDKEDKIVLSESYKINSAENRIKFHQKNNNNDETDKMPSKTCNIEKTIKSGYQGNNDSKEQHKHHSTSTSTATYFVLNVSILSKKNLNSTDSKNNNNQQDNNESSSSISDVMQKNGSYPNSTFCSSATIDEGEISHHPGIFITKRGITKRAILRSLSTQLSLVLTEKSKKGRGALTSSHAPALPCSGSLTVYPHVTISHSLKLHLASQNTLHGINKSPHIAHNTHNASSTHSKKKTKITKGNTPTNKSKCESENENKNENKNENENENENEDENENENEDQICDTLHKDQNTPSVREHVITSSDRVVVSLTEQTLDYIPWIDETSEIIVSYL